MSFNLPITIERCDPADIRAGYCPRCSKVRGAQRSTLLELKYRGGGYEWHQCRRCFGAFVTEI